MKFAMKKTEKIPSQAYFGWTPDRPDFRDRLFARLTPPKKLPSFVDLRDSCPIIVDQGQLGSCTANALAGAVLFMHFKDNTGLLGALSRLFIYYNERVLEGTVSADAGATLRDGIKTLAAKGVCIETAWPYDIRQFAQKPSVSCYKAALKERIGSYHRILTLMEMQQCLADGFPFVFGFTVYESFDSARVAKTGVVPLPRLSERVIGGHAVMAVGYNDKTRRFIVRNSWGSGWGQLGYCTMPYAYLANRNLADDFWTIRA